MDHGIRTPDGRHLTADTARDVVEPAGGLGLGAPLPGARPVPRRPAPSDLRRAAALVHPAGPAVARLPGHALLG